LLELDPDLVGQLLLGHPDHPAAVADAFANMGVYRMLHKVSLPRKFRRQQPRSDPETVSHENRPMPEQ
jgi:hypothetical protein